MPVIPVQPLYLQDMTFSVAADDYAAHVSSVTLTPSTSTTTWKGGKPSATFTRTSTPTWGCELAFAQDWESADSLSRYLWEHQGETVDVIFAPETGGTSWAVSINVIPGSIGGAVDGYATSTVTLGVDGAPVPTFGA